MRVFLNVIQVVCRCSMSFSKMYGFKQFVTVGIIVNFLPGLQLVAASTSAPETYPYKHVKTYDNLDYMCNFDMCRLCIEGVDQYQLEALLYWFKTVRPLRDDSASVRLFAELEDAFRFARTYNCDVCVQDYEIVLESQKMLYDHAFEVCAIEATEENIVNYKLNMSAIRREVQYVDMNSYALYLNCGDNQACQERRISLIKDEFASVEAQVVRKIAWLEKQLVFNNINSVRECVAHKTKEQVEDLKKIIATVQQCISYLHKGT